MTVTLDLTNETPYKYIRYVANEIVQDDAFDPSNGEYVFSEDPYNQLVNDTLSTGNYNTQDLCANNLLPNYVNPEYNEFGDLIVDASNRFLYRNQFTLNDLELSGYIVTPPLLKAPKFINTQEIVELTATPSGFVQGIYEIPSTALMSENTRVYISASNEEVCTGEIRINTSERQDLFSLNLYAISDNSGITITIKSYSDDSLTTSSNSILSEGDAHGASRVSSKTLTFTNHSKRTVDFLRTSSESILFINS